MNSYRRPLQESIAVFHERSWTKAFVVFLIILSVIQPPTLAFAGEPTEAPAYANDAEYFYYIHDDHLGSSMLLTEGKDSAKHAGITYKKGQILQRFEYAPFGQEVYALNPNLKFDPSYTGQMYDIETGLYYYKARYYDPLLGRFIQPDTIVQDAKDLQSYNRYSYVQNNPLNLVDPSGHFSWKKFFGALFGGLVAGLTFGLLAPFIGPILATLAAGILGGATAGGIMGGAKGALMGAAFGGLTAAAAVLVGGAVLMGIGLGLTIKNDGWAGLIYFGAGLVGAYAGNKIGSSWAQRIQVRMAARDSNPYRRGLNYRPGKAHFDYNYGERSVGLRASLGPDTSAPTAWGVGGDITAGGGGGALLGARGSLAGGAVYDAGSGSFYRYGTAEFDTSNFAFGGSAGAGAELSFYTGNIQDFAGAARTLNIAFNTVSISITPGANGSLFFTLMPGTGIGGGFELTGVNSHTIVKPLFEN